MWPDDAQLILRKSRNFMTSIVRSLHDDTDDDDQMDTDITGGIIYGGKLGWLANRANLEVVFLHTGERVSVFDFNRAFGLKDAYVSCVVEIPVQGHCILAVGLQLSPAGGKICLVSVHGSEILSCIDLVDKVISCCFVPPSPRTLLRIFDGCLAVGTDHGIIILLDICLKRAKNIMAGTSSSEDNLKVTECYIMDGSAEQNRICTAHQQYTRHEQIYFGIQLAGIDETSLIMSLLAIPVSLTLIAGHNDGRMVLYNLELLEAFHVAFPPEPAGALMFLSYVEPADDPRACIYVWAQHATADGAIGTMHSIMFERKFVDEVEVIYKDFQMCSARLTMPFHDDGSFPISVRAISKVIDVEEELKLTLFTVVWVTSQKTANLMIFDLNQWYKEQMPEIGDWRQFPSYTASFPLGATVPLDLYVNEQNVVPFNSIQRPEEHFYPNSLSFDVSILSYGSILNVHWPGLQNKILQSFVAAESAAILEPAQFFKEMKAAALHPKFQEFYISHTHVSLHQMREFLLTIALEYNFVSFLKKLSLQIADGSHTGTVPAEALALSTITDWLWSRARALKEVSNNFTVPLFDYSTRDLDAGIRRTLSHCTAQMRGITDVMELICDSATEFIPPQIHETLRNQLESMKLSTEYQELVQWLLNVGILPEGPANAVPNETLGITGTPGVPFPHHEIAATYRQQRKATSSRYIYIDNFIENNCDIRAIATLWHTNGDNGLYPPKSMQDMLRVLLLPGFALEAKHVLFVYLFMDLNNLLDGGMHVHAIKSLIKFPAVFKMNPAVIKATQAFWHLDHGDIETAVEELISPFSQERNLEKWQRDFLISTLLKHNRGNLALRALKSPGIPIDPYLEIDTLLANDLVSEAFKFQRSKGDANLLVHFFKGTMRVQKRDTLLDLSLNEGEAKLLVEFLEKSRVPLCENTHFVYLLQRSAFVDAMSLVNRLAHAHPANQMNLTAPREILSIFHKTLEPTTRQLTVMAYSHPEKFKLRKVDATTPLRPLSSSLIKQKTDPTLGLFQKSILSIKEASSGHTDDGEDNNAVDDDFYPFIRQSKLGIFSFTQKTQTNNVVYPVVVTGREGKRQIESKEPENGPFNLDEARNPRKKTKFNENEYPKKALRDYDTSIFSRFNDQLKPTFNFTGGVPVQFEKTPEKQIPVTQTRLLTPVINRVAVRDESSPERVHRYTPQSILKASSQASFARSTTPLSQFSRKSYESEEKSIRFAIPRSSGAGTTGVDINSSIDTSLNESMDISAADKSSVVESSAPQSPMDETPDEYYSPETSEVQQTTGHDDLSFLSESPQARPSIHAGGDVTKSAGTKKPSKDLTRLVLEANTKRSIVAEVFGETHRESEYSFGDITVPELGKSNILSDDPAVNEEILREFKAKEHDDDDGGAEESAVNITDESAFAKVFAEKSGFLSTSGEYEDSRAETPHDESSKVKAATPAVSIKSSDESDEDDYDEEDTSSSSGRDKFAQPSSDEDAEHEEDLQVDEEETFDSSKTPDYDSSVEIESPDKTLETPNKPTPSKNSSSVICLDSSSDESTVGAADPSTEVPMSGPLPSFPSYGHLRESRTGVSLTTTASSASTAVSDDDRIDFSVPLSHGESVYGDENDENFAVSRRDTHLYHVLYAQKEAPPMPQGPEETMVQTPKTLEPTDSENQEHVYTSVEAADSSIVTYSNLDEAMVGVEDGDDGQQPDEFNVSAASFDVPISSQLMEATSADTSQEVHDEEQQEEMSETGKNESSDDEKQLTIDEGSVCEQIEQEKSEIEEAVMVTKEAETPNEIAEFKSEQESQNTEELKVEESTNAESPASPAFVGVRETKSAISVTTTASNISIADTITSSDNDPSTLDLEHSRDLETDESVQQESSYSQPDPEAAEKSAAEQNEGLSAILYDDLDEKEEDTEEGDNLNNAIIGGVVQTETIEVISHTKNTRLKIVREAETEEVEEKDVPAVTEEVVYEAKTEIEKGEDSDMNLSVVEEAKHDVVTDNQSIIAEVSMETATPTEEKSENVEMPRPEEITPPKVPAKRRAESIERHDTPSTSRGSSVPRELPVRALRSRAQSVDFKPSILDSPYVQRSLRGTSVPKSKPDSQTQPKTRRLAKEIPENETIDTAEEVQPSPRKTRRLSNVSDTPTRRTRKTSDASSVGSNTPNVVTRSASRQMSVEREGTPDVMHTPRRRVTRAQSRELSTPRDTPKRASSRRLSTLSQQSDSSVQSSQSLQVEKAKMMTPPARRSARSVSISPSDTPPTPTKATSNVAYTDSRRLTRSQRMALERNMRTMVPPEIPTSQRVTEAEAESDDESAESVVSTVSGKSKRSTRSTRAKNRAGSTKGVLKDSETESNYGQDLAGPSTRGRKRKLQEQAESVVLEAIPEEQSLIEKENTTSTEEEDKKAGPVTRKRSKK